MSDKIDPIKFASNYTKLLYSTFEKVDMSQLQDFIKTIENAIISDKLIYAFGNGGSAAISNHLLCDFSKGISTHTCLSPRIVSLSSSPEIITALLNDIGSESIFEGQLKNIIRPGDICIAISSSGNSENIIKAVKYAKSVGSKILGLTGFDGGRLIELSDICIHVKCNNYGIVEDIHQSIMHLISQYINFKYHE